MINGKRVIDSFLFFNEVEMAYFRMTELDSFVDYFVVVESNRTFSGKDKPLNFFRNRERFKNFRHKIIYRPYRGATSSDAWQNERWQRNFITKALIGLIKDNDLFCLSDVDEIPNFDAVKPKHNFELPHVFMMDMYKYRLTHLHSRQRWRGTKVMFWNAYKLKFKEMEEFRVYNKIDCGEIQNGGWHLTFFGDVTTIQNKVSGFAHTELNRPEFTNEKHILQAIETGSDLFNRPSIIEEIDVYQESNLPKYKNLLI